MSAAGGETDNPRAVLLDTCAVIWLANGDPIAPAALGAITHAALADGVFVSPASAWEVGLLSRVRGDKAPAISFLPDPQSWFARFMSGPAIREAPLLPEIAIASSLLPDPLHGDPADRFIIATARLHRMPVVTRDGKIIDYAAKGHVAAIEC
ncbi:MULTISPECIES: type II toxin-antitoxin system VapC family toxin [Sphingomonadaceae]|uniref:type II toxin-antitoxin system VapC family toxin n=1 Tax=Sphingomonadales TaxID=204457 RepID=UPI00076FE8FA|nr:type II toxin-antitoxin system VapC family toxin [Sphingobium sp. TKS]AMK23256.1 putative toxin [Sphingobium sp. TKS]MCF8709068.1 type II toxin-antitoxin system VapC family toxin [Rhizorhapis sp. SPR117]